ncbi:kinase-like domain-containing protein [Tribonema minus]|uniref:non-specific serine/threonine protein kinase n=1 Tax=Tribonema minus TaxID=303371 RepID=A0A835YHY9_9STRA|nr:kinase-like domain-containing protein [Tribonema minus]
MPPVDNLVGSAQQAGVEFARDEAVQPEHQFAMQMARAQPWKERLTPGGKQAYMDLVSFFSASGLMMSFDDLQLRAVIGSGAFATVFRAIYRKRDVAVKKLMGGGGGPMEKTLRDFKTEAALLSRLRHRNIIAPIGATADPVTIVMEYCSRGNLMMLLNDTAIDLPWPRRLRMCVDVAAGMRYLHTQNPVIIHRDLKSLNVLVDDNWVSKVTDFGLSRFKATSESEKMTGQAGTYHWMSPEVINSQHYTEKADVFSFGIIMWEVYTRSIPYDGMQPVQVVAAVLGRRERPRIPATCPPILAALIQQCWSHDPAVRPAFDEIHARLEAMPS